MQESRRRMANHVSQGDKHVSVNYGGGSPGDGGAGQQAISAGRVDMGVWLGQAWALFSARPGVWMVSFLLYLILGLGLWLLWAIPTGILDTLKQSYLAVLNHTGPPVRPPNPLAEFAKTRLFGLVLAAANAVFFGGFYKMALRQMRGERISVGGLFSGFPQALPLAMVAVALAAGTALLEAASLGLLRLLGLPPAQAVSLSNLIGVLPSLVLQAVLIFAPLLVVDRGANAAEAIKGSLRLLKGQWLIATLTYFLLALIAGLGALGCLVGMLVTYPLFLISVAVGYLAFTQPPSSAPFPYPNAYGGPAPPGVWPPPPGAAPSPPPA